MDMERAPEAISSDRAQRGQLIRKLCKNLGRQLLQRPEEDPGSEKDDDMLPWALGEDLDREIQNAQGGRSMVTGHSQAPCPSHKKLKSEKPERGDMMAVIEEELSDSDEYGPEIILSIGAPVPRQM
ncbi:hypothetical protein AK812_SmicGene31723 [Symbiodinium microadriaticum]|uniref:Uncharacterized protein n=1 Tax=Symbiodinium microadriaticum TaxID=2951 RepID=A0A1Q9CW24_SYMMI|nr:hypothetical protein AK812_SmicGene31723 [Symbiodinium microadriaticum]CAE7563970.1 unnamed protein product [Symbiodinium microadriaticum]CAE7880292.1 unnamed protein product [Symbiodinium sp. KB8]